MPQLRPGPGVRARLAARNAEAIGYQPISLFRRDPPRKLDRVPRDDDPWRVTVRRIGMVSWQDGATIGHGEGATLDVAIDRALGPGDMLGSMARLGAEIDNLVVVLRA